MCALGTAQRGMVGLNYIHQAGISSAQKARKQKELHDLIVEILWRNPRLKYYQAGHEAFNDGEEKGS